MEERSMVPHQREEPFSTSQRTRRDSRIHWTVISIAVIASIVFAVTAILILINEGISQGAVTLTILSIIFGVVIGLLGLVFNFLQWLNSRPSSSSNSSTAFASSSQSSSSEQVSASSPPYH